MLYLIIVDTTTEGTDPDQKEIGLKQFKPNFFRNSNDESAALLQ